jgi:hypothetical protein
LSLTKREELPIHDSLVAYVNENKSPIEPLMRKISSPAGAFSNKKQAK